VFSHSSIDDGNTVKITYLELGSPITAEQFFARLQDRSFAIDFSKRLSGQAYKGAFLECPAYSSKTSDLPFQCVLINSPDLDLKPANPSAFVRKLAEVTEDGSGVFPNINNSATLISPQAKAADYSHLLAFLRRANPHQIANLWETTSKVVLQQAGDDPLWISTSGLGVPWLHIRVDTQPKYYRHLAYLPQPQLVDE
jgi:hypothetical protein